MIEIKNCTKIYRKNHAEKKALDHIDLNIGDSGFVFIVGKSGSGKSTLLNLIANFDTATEGTIRYDGTDLSTLKEKERDRYLFDEVGFVFQTYNLFDELSVKDNIALGLKGNSRILKEEIARFLKEVDLEGYEDKKVRNLSGGEKQRVALARALVKDPKVLLCDEPCGNLDNVNSKKVLDILKARSEQSLVLIVSHSMNDAYLYADRIITLQDGKVLNDKYIDTREKHPGTYVIKDLNHISDQEFDQIRDGILNKEISSIRSRKELFKDFDQKIEPKIRERREKNGGFMKSFFTNLKLINSRIFKICAFVLITGFALGILSSVLTLERFDPAKFNKNAVLNNSSDIICYDKAYFDGKEENSNYLGKASDEDIKFLDENYQGRYFERKAFSIHTVDTQYQFLNNRAPSFSNFSSFYSVELQGLNIVDEAFLKDILDLDEIVILNQSNYDKGVYITDYFADSMLFHNGFKNYDELMKKFSEKNLNISNHNYARIKGIIQTGYHEKLKPIIDQIENGKKVTELLQREEYRQYYDYLRLGLNSAYTYDRDFAVDGDVENIYIHGIDSPLGRLMYGNYKAIKLQKKNTLLLEYGTIAAAYPMKTKDEIQKILDSTEFELSFITNQNNENEIPRFKTKVNIDFVENYSSEISNQQVRGYNYLLSEDLYSQFKKECFYTIGFLFDDKKIYDLDSALKEHHIILNNIYYEYGSAISSQVAKFNDVFRILDVFCLILSVFIMVYYAFSVIKDNRYNIGVLKSLGYRGNELSVFFFSSFMVYSIVTACLFGAIFSWLTKLLNNVLIFSLAKGFSISNFTSIPIISFDWNIFFVVSASLLVSTLVFSLIYLFILRKFRIIKVIQNKE